MERRRSQPASRAASAGRPPWPAPAARRVTPAQERRGLERWVKILFLEKDLKSMQPNDVRRDRLQEELAATWRLLRDWNGGVH